MEAAEDYTKNLLGPGASCAVATADEMSSKDDPGDMTFCMSKYAKDVLKMMYMMRSHHMLTDVVLEVEKELFHVHKVVLSAASPYFKAMFTGGLKECEMPRVKLQGICPTAMGRMIYFMYTGHIRVTEVTVCQLLPAATMFQVPHVVDACCAFLERQLDPTNAIGISNFAEQHGCDALKQKANQFIERHFTQICQEEEFLQLSAIQLISMIRKDELNVQGEREVYNAVLNWVKYDEDNRYPKMEHILYAVRCQFLPPSFLKEQMKNCHVLRKAPACREYLARIFMDLTLHKRPVVKERRPNTTRMIFVAGGYLRGSLDIVEAFNVDDKMWTTLPSLRVPRSGLGAAFLKGNFYAVGGRNNTPGASYDSDWVDRYHPLNEQWRPCSPMTVPRHRAGVAVMDELLYAIGGSAGSEYHSSVEYFDPEEDRWTIVQPMHSKRFGVGVAVVNRLLYAIGGFDGNDRLASMECYHPENNAWTILPSMKLGRSGAGVAALNHFIYVVGGFDGQRHLSSVERYDTEQQIWEMVSEIKTARSALSLTVLDGKLFAMGGFDGQNFLTIVEVYDPALNAWSEGTTLTSGRSGHASAVIYHPSCVAGGVPDSAQVSLVEKEKNELDLRQSSSTTQAVNSNNCNSVGNASGNSSNSPNYEAEMEESNGSEDRLPISQEQLSLATVRNDRNGNADGTPPKDDSVDMDTAESSSSNNNNSNDNDLGKPEVNPFKNNLLDINLLKSMCNNSSVKDGFCSYFQQSSGSSASNQAASSSLNSCTLNVSNRMPSCFRAKKKSIENAPIPICDTVNNGRGPVQDENDVPMELPVVPPTASHYEVKTFLPIVDFQNQKKSRRKITPASRHPHYLVSSPSSSPSSITSSYSNNCAMNLTKIKEVVKQKLFAPSLLLPASICGSKTSTSMSSYHNKIRQDRSNELMANRKIVLGMNLSTDEEDDEAEQQKSRNENNDTGS